MANTITIETILDGTRNTIIKVDIIGDGSGEESGTVIYDASAYDNKTTLKKLYQIQHQFNGFSVWLDWSGTAAKQLITMAEEHYEHPTYDWVGGLSNATTTGYDGDILLNTTGLGAGDRGYMILHVQHKEIKAGEQ